MLWLFTDGSSSRKQKSIGSGYIVFDEPKIGATPIFQGNLGLKGVENIKTGASELIAILLGFEELVERDLHKEKIMVYADSQYAINELSLWFKDQLVRRFYDVKNTEVLTYILEKKIKFTAVNFFWIKGHPKVIKNFLEWGNSLADELATSAHREDKGIKLDDLHDYTEFISDIKIRNEEDNVFNKIYNHYIIQNNL